MWEWGPGMSGVKTRILNYVFGTVFSLTVATPGGDREGGGGQSWHCLCGPTSVPSMGQFT